MTNPYHNQDPQYGANPYQQAPQYGANPYQQQDPQQGYGHYGQQPSQPTYQQQAYPQPGPAEKGFFARLFDLSFDQYVTTSIIKVIFIISVVLQGLWAIYFMAAGFFVSTGAGILTLILAPIAWFFALLLTRVWMELLIVIFKIKEDLGAIRTRGGF